MEESYQINDLMLHLKLLEKQRQTKPKSSRRGRIRIKSKFNEIETEKPYKESMEKKVVL
jgi:hypothetical protein